MESPKQKYIAAAVQAAPVFLNKRETIGKVCSLIEEARENGADLIVFPEAFIPAYPYWPKDLGTGPERKLVLDAYMELYKNSVEIPSEDTESVYGVWVVQRTLEFSKLSLESLAGFFVMSTTLPSRSTQCL
jgi:predicted amidohydrolase